MSPAAHREEEKKEEQHKIHTQTHSVTVAGVVYSHQTLLKGYLSVQAMWSHSLPQEGE